MRALASISACYSLISTELDSRLDGARAASNHAAVQTLENQQRINDAAYFVLVWGQLETRINDVCEAAISKHLSSADWERRRAWETFSTDPKAIRREKFLDRMTLVLDRSLPEFGLASRLYQQRNQVAHGRSFASGVDVPAIIGQLFQIESQLRD